MIEIPEWAQFQASLSLNPVYLDDGILRYEAKTIARWIGDHVDLNEMWTAYRNGAFSRDEFMQFYRDIGYSLGGFEEVWGEELEGMEATGVDALNELLSNAFDEFASLRNGLRGWLATMPVELREGSRKWPDLENAISCLEEVVSEPVLFQGIHLTTKEE